MRNTIVKKRVNKMKMNKRCEFFPYDTIFL